MGIDGVYIEGKMLREKEPERVYVTLVYFALLSWVLQGELICIILIEIFLYAVSRATERQNDR